MAIDDLLDEHEQSERVLAWLRRNGAGLIGGIVLGMAAIGGWKWWQQHREQQQVALAGRYDAVAKAVKAGDAKAADLVKAMDPGPYHTLASLELARAQVAAGQRDAAIATLRGVRSEDPAVAQIVNQRLARLLIDAKQADAALKVIGTADSATALEIVGDAHYALGKRDRARETYARALAKLDVGSPQRRVLELKLTEVGGSPVQPEARS